MDLEFFKKQFNEMTIVYLKKSILIKFELKILQKTDEFVKP